jgi:hypothetical protein
MGKTYTEKLDEKFLCIMLAVEESYKDMNK